MRELLDLVGCMLLGPFRSSASREAEILALAAMLEQLGLIPRPAAGE